MSGVHTFVIPAVFQEYLCSGSGFSVASSMIAAVQGQCLDRYKFSMIVPIVKTGLIDPNSECLSSVVYIVSCYF